MKNAESYQELLLRYLDGNLLPEEEAQIADLLRCNPEARAFLREVAEQAVTVADVERVEERQRRELEARQDWAGNRREALSRIGGPRTRFARWPWAIAAVAVVALIASVYFQWPSAEREIAKITGLSGSLQWTGDGGRVVRDLNIETELSGGTIEGMAPDSWFELEFNDGSTVAISGNSMLTFSDHGQKKLHLKEGNVSGNVKPQPAGKPMLIYTRSAMFEVLGTQFEIEARLSATILNVSEGKVRVKRLSDGSTVDVPAKHRVIVAADCELSPVLVPDSVNRWISQLHLGPNDTQGKWSPKTDEEDAKLRAVPFTTHLGKTIYTASLGVSRGDKPPVIFQPTSRFRVRGHIASAHKVYFGVTVRHAGGEFAGNFQTIRPAVEFQSGQDFEVILHLRDFRLDPSLIEMKNKLPNAPFGLVVESFWCHTLNEQAGLEVTKVELIPPACLDSETGEVLWRRTDLNCDYMQGPVSSPVLYDDLLYTISDRGVLICKQAMTGETVWTKRLGGRYGASLLYADNRIYVSSKQGKTTIIEPGRTFRELAVNKLDGEFWASPAVAGESMLLRTKTHLYRVQSR